MFTNARLVVVFLGLHVTTLASAVAQSPCNTWQELPKLPFDNASEERLAFDSASQTLYQAAIDEGADGSSPSLPWVGKRVGNGWVTLLDPSAFSFGLIRGIEVLDVGSGPALYAFGVWTSTVGYTNLLKWNGTSFASEPAVPGRPDSLTTFDDGTGVSLYVGVESYGVYRLSAGSWTSVGALGSSDFNRHIYALCVHDDSSGPALYAAGDFHSIGGVTAEGIARWNGTTWSSLGSGIAGATNLFVGPRIRSLVSIREEAGPRLYASGGFLTIDGQTVNSIACFDGTQWTGVGNHFSATIGEVESLVGFDDGTGNGSALVATGWTSAPSVGQFLKRIADGVWSDALSTQPTLSAAPGRALLVADLPETSGLDLIAPVISTTVGQTTARLEACTQTGRIFCTGDGSSSACPCANESPAAARAGCLHSGGVGGALRARGRASLSADSLHLDGSGMPNGSLLYFQGTQELAPFVFGDGLKCTGGALIRLRTLFNVGGASTYPEVGGPLLSAQGHVSAPGTRYYQARYRNSANFCTSASFNYTNGVAVVWNP